MRHWKCCFAMVVLALGLSAALRADGPISVVMDDGTVVKGTLLGVDNGSVTLQKANGKSVDLELDQVKKAFDADGNAVRLGGAQAAPAAQAKAVAADADDEDDQVVPRDRHRRARSEGRHGSLQARKTAGEVLFWSGTGVALVGLGIALYGDELENNATNSLNYTAPYGYYDYQISGYSGWYDYDEYAQYYEGQAWVDTGLVVGVVGVACMVTGLIVEPSARQMQQDALLDFHDGKVDLGVPPMTMDRTRGTRTTLAMVHF
ncbi:MAG TPA: hypothetical protein VNZ54_10935 [bacterium]|jgi:hypothetical protein|nr:hypothetical protein [bacterium]